MNKTYHEIFDKWRKLNFSKILKIEQSEKQFKIEFVIDERPEEAKRFLKKLYDITIKKHPSGSICWSGHWGVENSITTQYRLYRLFFQDDVKELLDSEKVELFIKKLMELLDGTYSKKV